MLLLSFIKFFETKCGSVGQKYIYWLPYIGGRLVLTVITKPSKHVRCLVGIAAINKLTKNV